MMETVYLKTHFSFGVTLRGFSREGSRVHRQNLVERARCFGAAAPLHDAI